MLDRRLQILIDEERYERLRAESKRRGAPVGELVRRAIDRQYQAAGQELTPAGAAKSLLDYPQPDGAEPDWEDQKQNLLDDPLRER